MRLRTVIFPKLLGLMFVMGGVSRLAGQEPKGATAPETSAGHSVRAFLQRYLKTGSLKNDTDTRYRVAFVDLNVDGTPEAVVYIIGNAWCGSGGCPLLVLSKAGSSYRVVARITIVRPPIYVMTHLSNGWRDIAVRVQGGGIHPGYDSELRFDGKTYPTNPSVPPARKVNEAAARDVIIPVSGEDLPLNP